MSYTNFAYYFRPHGWYPRHDPYRFCVRQFFRGNWHDAAQRYLMRRISMEMGRFATELKDLHVASRRIPRNFKHQTNPAWNVEHRHDRDLDMGAGL